MRPRWSLVIWISAGEYRFRDLQIPAQGAEESEARGRVGLLKNKQKGGDVTMRPVVVWTPRGPRVASPGPWSSMRLVHQRTLGYLGEGWGA